MKPELLTEQDIEDLEIMIRAQFGPQFSNPLIAKLHGLNEFVKSLQVVKYDGDICYKVVNDDPYGDKVQPDGAVTLPKVMVEPSQLDRMEEKLDKVLASVTYNSLDYPLDYYQMPPVLDDFEAAMAQMSEAEDKDGGTNGGDKVQPHGADTVAWEDDDA